MIENNNISQMEHELSLQKAIEQFRKDRKLKLVVECIRCGKCCEGKVKIFQINREQKTVDLIDVRSYGCKHYDPQTKQCRTYTSRHHAMCYMFPYLPENIPEGCGFHFEEIDTGESK